ncbi:MAG: hypothetical protein KGJ90_00215 [Patescibacteria group bacterium]|nr:hypothetical protein [Patescibacteria group bacterium]
MREQRRLDKPECGYWVMTLCRGGPEVVACIIFVQTIIEEGTNNLMDRSPFMIGVINGEIVSVDDVWTRRGRPISEEEYYARLSKGIVANPYQKVKLSDEKLPF